jgi:transcriptional regulator with XRE-family HTH domain
MPVTGDAASRLDEAMNERRIALGLEWKQIAQRAGLSEFHLRRIRRGQYKPRELTRAELERVLEWAPGSIDAILDGRLPTALDEQAPEDMDWTTVEPPESDFQAIVGHWGELSDFTRQLVIKIAREARAEAEKRNGPGGQRRDAEA